MTEDINTYLYRPLLDGSKYENLIPKSNCKKTDAGIGYTDHSVNKMKEVIETYSWQMEQVAQELQKSSLDKTIQAIHNFCYNYFQYKADNEDQLLRSPACSWHDRYNGIDCKSYSILAASCLIELGISCFIRKIKQPGYAPDEFTHVYVVVPKDQKTFNLNKGYYIVDGTLKNNVEPPYIETKDEFMSGLQHYALNAPALGEPTSNQEGSWVSKSFEFIKNLNLKDISIKNIKNLFSKIGCIGGSAFTKPKLESNLDRAYKYYESTLTAINNAIAEHDYNELSQLVTEFYGTSKIFVLAMEKKRSEGWNSCSTQNFDANLKALRFFRDTVGGALKIYIQNYFNTGAISGTLNFTSNDLESAKGYMFMSTGINLSEKKYTLTLKSIVTQVPAFEITEYLSKKFESPTPLNADDFLKTLQTVITVFQPAVSPTNPNIQIDPNTGQPFTPKVQEAGMGVLGWGLIGGAILYGIKKFSS